MINMPVTVSIGGIHCAADQELVRKNLKAQPNINIGFRMRTSTVDRKFAIVSGIDQAALEAIRPDLQQALDEAVYFPTQIVHAQESSSFAPPPETVRPAPASMPLG